MSQITGGLKCFLSPVLSPFLDGGCFVAAATFPHLSLIIQTVLSRLLALTSRRVL